MPQRDDRSVPLLLRLLLVAALFAGCSKAKSIRPQPPLQPPPATAVDSNLAIMANGGGCTPGPISGVEALDFSDVNPSWVPVINGTQIDSTPVHLHGTVVNAHGNTGGDFPENHTSSDIVTDVQLDASMAGFAATGNDTPGVIALEWESGALATFAWPTAGDQVTAQGRWIFDCGHPNAAPGACSVHTGVQCATVDDCSAPLCKTCVAGETCQGVNFHYNTEMHPPYATAVSRLGRGGVVSSASGAPATLATRTDVFASSYGGGAGDRCVLTHVDDDDTFLVNHNCYPLSQPLSASYFNTWDFEFDIPLPARPGTATPAWRIVNQPTQGVAAAIQITPQLTGATPTLHAVVQLSQPVGGKLPTVAAATIFAGWAVPPPAPLTHVRLTMNSLTIHNPLRPATPIIVPVKDWVLTGSANGEAQSLIGLSTPSLGDVIQQNLVFDQYLPPDGQLHVLVEGTAHTCIDTLFGQAFQTDIAAVGIGGLEQCLLSTDADPGDVDVTYKGPDFGAAGGRMAYQTASVHGSGGFCSVTTATPCLNGSDCPSGESCAPADGAYTLEYTVENVP